MTPQNYAHEHSWLLDTYSFNLGVEDRFGGILSWWSNARNTLSRDESPRIVCVGELVLSHTCSHERSKVSSAITRCFSHNVKMKI
jgi:hypothetical protein